VHVGGDPLEGSLEEDTLALFARQWVVEALVQHKLWRTRRTSQLHSAGKTQCAGVSLKGIGEDSLERWLACLIRLVPELARPRPSPAANLDPDAPAHLGVAPHPDRQQGAQEVPALYITGVADATLIRAEARALCTLRRRNLEIGVRTIVTWLDVAKIVLLAAGGAPDAIHYASTLENNRCWLTPELTRGRIK